jgi:dynein heavy chain, axonemal
VQGIDAVIADVNNMLLSVKQVPFNVFDRELSLDWQNVVNIFRAQNEKAKAATRSLIDTSFRRLRSAEGAFELLQNFKKIESKGAIKEQMASKLNDILDQLSREIDSVSANFAEHWCVPSLCQACLRHCLDMICTLLGMQARQFCTHILPVALLPVTCML